MFQKNEAKLKIKASQRKLAEFKQSTSLQIFELKQENEDLKSTVSLQSSRPSTCQKRASRSDIHAPVSQGPISQVSCSLSQEIFAMKCLLIFLRELEYHYNVKSHVFSRRF